jgi:hypothetical protein
VGQVEIRIKNEIDHSWSEYLGGLDIAHDGQGHTILKGYVRDQSALLGLLNRLSGMGLEILSVDSGS